jgi:hypothetical protein
MEYGTGTYPILFIFLVLTLLVCFLAISPIEHIFWLRMRQVLFMHNITMNLSFMTTFICSLSISAHWVACSSLKDVCNP